MRELLLENRHLRVAVLPELGGKIGSLLGLRDGREHLLQPPGRARRPAEYAAPFDEYDTSGFDECFPTVGACELDEGIRLPDHGELWPVAWELLEQTSTSIQLQATGRALPYAFRRRLQLEGTRVVLDYEVLNLGSRAFPYLWSSHPLLEVAPGDRIEIPGSVETVEVEWSAAGRLSGRVPWNEALSRLGSRERGWAEKLFAGPLGEGWCRLVYSDGASLTFVFPPEQVPFLGLWICQGGWPGEGRPGHFTVALEPCTAPRDRLDQALARREARTLEPGARAAWRLSLQVRSAADPLVRVPIDRDSGAAMRGRARRSPERVADDEAVKEIAR